MVSACTSFTSAARVPPPAAPALTRLARLFFRFYKLLPLLTDPARHGGTADDAFDVVVPSLPGYGFSDKPLAHGFRLDWVLHLLAHLMTDTLGYRRFGAHGGDIGSGLAAWLARAYPEALVGII